MAFIIENSDKNIITLNVESKLLQQKIIMVTDEINQNTVTDYQEQLMYLMSKCKFGDIISFYINTPGGSVYDGLGLYDLMQYAKKKGIIIRTVNIGKACSMGAILLMAGTKGYRESLPNCSIMIHEISSWCAGKTSETKDSLQEMERLQAIMDNIISECSSPELVELCNRKDFWLSAQNALEHKVIDKII